MGVPVRLQSGCCCRRLWGNFYSEMGLDFGVFSMARACIYRCYRLCLWALPEDTCGLVSLEGFGNYLRSDHLAVSRPSTRPSWDGPSSDPISRSRGGGSLAQTWSGPTPHFASSLNIYGNSNSASMVSLFRIHRLQSYFTA